MASRNDTTTTGEDTATQVGAVAPDAHVTTAPELGAPAAAMPDGKDVVQVDVAMVNLAGGGTAEVTKGQTVPGNLPAGEMDRLRSIGVFDAPVRRNPYAVAVDALHATPSTLPGE